MSYKKIETQTTIGCVLAFIIFVAMWVIGLALGRTHALGSILLLGGIFFSIGLAIYMPIRGSVLKRRLRKKEAAFATSKAAPPIVLQQGVTEVVSVEIVSVVRKQRSEKEDSTAMYCPYCGKALPNDASFCMKCGKPLK